MHFGPDYRETLALRDGTPVVLRAIQPDDKAMLQSGLAQLSPESRYLRFFSDKSRLSSDELEYLTEVDGSTHLAIVALHAQTGAGLGVARYVCIDEGAAEPAIVVTDAYQNRGLGTLLLRRLSAAALERGVERFVAEFLDRNDRVRAMLRAVSPEVEFVQDDEVVRAYVPLSPKAADPAAEHHDGSAAYALFAEIAAGLVDLRHRLLVLKGRESDDEPSPE